MCSFARKGRAALGTLAMLFAVGGCLLAGCSDNPVGSDNGSDHADAVRIELRLDDQLLYGYDATDGTVSCDAPPCGLILTEVGASQAVDLTFRDETAALIPRSELEEDYSVRIEVADENVVTAAVVAHDAWHRLQVSAVGAGETTIRISLMHGSHADFSTPPMDDTRALVVRVEG